MNSSYFMSKELHEKCKNIIDSTAKLFEFHYNDTTSNTNDIRNS